MNWEEVINNIIGNATNGLIAGIFTVIGVIITNNFQKRNEKAREKKRKYKNKAELVAEHGDFKEDNEIDMQLLVARFQADRELNFKYSNEYKNKEEYIFKDFVFKNIGKTPIEELEIFTTYQKCISIFRIQHTELYMDNSFITYHCMWDKKIFPNQELKIRLYFHKDIIVFNTLVMQYRDSNGMWWEQSFFESDAKLYSPREISYKESRDNVSIQKAMECFEKPWLW